MPFAQARWRQLRSCAGALESIIWAYRTRVAPFEPDALHPNADDDKAERTLHLTLVEWRQGLAAGADLNSTTLRRRFPGWVFKHGQRRPKADSMCQSWINSLVMMWKYLMCCGTHSWTNTAGARTQARAQKENEQKTPAYCAPRHLQNTHHAHLHTTEHSAYVARFPRQDSLLRELQSGPPPDSAPLDLMHPTFHQPKASTQSFPV